MFLDHLSVDKIEANPDNPRKDLGDLAELVESIRSNGVLQNLLVVPLYNLDAPPVRDEEERYRLVIGHRRLAAAKLAGLEFVPCNISEMTREEQLATMLSENIQRSDLTALEQADGMQLLMDLGCDVAGIVKRTGFSESTVRRRLRLLELDRQHVENAMRRGATLLDLAEIAEKITDPAWRAKVLNALGTNNYRYEMNAALQAEKVAANRPKWMELLSRFAEKADVRPARATYAGYIDYGDDPSAYHIPDDAGSREYIFTENTETYAYLYRIFAETDGPAAVATETSEEAERRKRYDALDTIAERAYQLRRDFVKNFRGSVQVIEHEVEHMLRMALAGAFDRIYCYALAAELGIEGLERYPSTDDDRANNSDILNRWLENKHVDIYLHPESYLLKVIYGALCDTAKNPSHDYYCSYDRDDDTVMFYNLLEELGYEMADEERAYVFGTHELYVQPEDEDEEDDDEETEDEADV